MNDAAGIGFLSYFPLELLTAAAVYAFPLKKRNWVWVRLIISAAGAYAAILLMLGLAGWYQGKETDAAMAVGSGVGCFAIFAFMAMGIWFSCQTGLMEAVYCAACAYLTEHMVYCIRILVNKATDSEVAKGGSFWYFLIHIVVYIISYYLCAKQMVKEKHYAASAVQSLGLMLSVLFLVLGMSIVASAFQFEWIHGIYALFCCFFVLYSQVNQLKQLNLQKELHSNQQLWMKHKAQYEMSKENIDIINRKCHDLKHQIAALQKISDLEKQKKAIDSMEHSVMIYDSILETGNEILDTVLTEKSLVCNAHHIEMTCIADGKSLDFMDTVDLYTLFGNALDNAIEGVLKLENREERCISLLVHKKVNLIFIQVENRYQGELKMQNHLPVTKKTDKGYHGFGLKSIIHTAEEYGGFVTIETEQQMFLLRITIPEK